MPPTAGSHAAAAPLRGTFARAVRDASLPLLRGARLDTVQINIGLTCNLACHHCHVVSGPTRTEQMTRETLEHVLRLAEEAAASTIDITGGAPEMNPHFRWFVGAARARGLRVMVRTNLTILLEAGYLDLASFFADQGVHLVASLPCYLPENVDRQRGRHVHEHSIEAIRKLNAAGYGMRADLPLDPLPLDPLPLDPLPLDPLPLDPLPLDLVYNPLGAHLPPSEKALERDYRRVLGEEYGIHFTRLIAITNMAIGRFLGTLERKGQAEEYARLLRESFNPATVDGLMCRHQIHVAHDGTLHDCDFNYALGMACTNGRVDPQDGSPVALRIDRADAEALRSRRILTAEHCFGCTAGAGSSCGGTLA